MSVVYFPREVFINLRRSRSSSGNYCRPRENYKTRAGRTVQRARIVARSNKSVWFFVAHTHTRIHTYVRAVLLCAHARERSSRPYYARVNAVSIASYGPAFRQTRRHCRRPIIRAAANSTSVHDAAQSWRTTVNRDCSVIRVNTMGKKNIIPRNDPQT